MSGDLPSPLLITKDFVATSGEEKVYHPTRGPKREFRFLSETASLQEAGRALAIGLHRTILPKPFSCLFGFFSFSNEASGDKFLPTNEEILLQSSHSFPVDPSSS